VIVKYIIFEMARTKETARNPAEYRDRLNPLIPVTVARPKVVPKKKTKKEVQTHEERLYKLEKENDQEGDDDVEDLKMPTRKQQPISLVSIKKLATRALVFRITRGAAQAVRALIYDRINDLALRSEAVAENDKRKRVRHKDVNLALGAMDEGRLYTDSEAIEMQEQGKNIRSTRSDLGDEGLGSYSTRIMREQRSMDYVLPLANVKYIVRWYSRKPQTHYKTWTGEAIKSIGNAVERSIVSLLALANTLAFHSKRVTVDVTDISIAATTMPAFTYIRLERIARIEDQEAKLKRKQKGKGKVKGHDRSQPEKRAGAGAPLQQTKRTKLLISE
jgi:histone H3/H4